MKTLTILLISSLLISPAFAQEAVKVNKPVSVGELSADPNIHQAMYKVLAEKGISCTGLATKKDGTITILNASKADVKITAQELQVAVDKIKTEKEIQVKIEKRIRELATADLKAKGEIPKDYAE